MRISLEKLLYDIEYQLTILDIDQDEDLHNLYDELVPVLFASKSPDASQEGMKKLCHYFLDQEKVKAFCNE